MKTAEVKRAIAWIDARIFFVELRNELSRKQTSDISLVVDDGPSKPRLPSEPVLSFSPGARKWGLSRSVVERMIDRELELANAELKKLEVED